ncbi:UDP-N-acetylmuramate--L-alanine ligase [Nonlabens xylanidelens]|uniref:UDP-N-acetylmuramate--L-alanine ligase n=1 Tax=Nonlabens xylanidelens TaxID=191564 RepID=A0A2S6IJN4_9FLAO|nr:UDP-N-acetylmuramate--L-alanine ligase [Nonlabens xylanidelens]PPK94444.1 UDP-N-acetylmuramate--L-alanine ligase [Nonlabens xylanidelens]PQJ21397.1 UDP-N-acetylmuramate--L-alanine ligase [Nonlabens xylanidelens]
MKELEHISHFYFIGIGGIGMSALARYLNDQGKHVAGYDRVVTALSKKLEDEGISIHYSDSFGKIPEEFKNIETAQVIYTPAVPADFGELVRFRESGINILKRAQLLGQISRTMTCLAIAGTHGKTTTSAILAHLLYKSDVKVTAFLGGILEGYDTNYLCSGTDVMVVEADEFDRSFMQLDPDIAGITSMDADHLDIYGDAATFEKTFHDFAGLLDGKTLLLNEKLDLQGLKVGLDSGDYEAVDEVIIDGAYHFDLITPQGKIDKCLLKLPGKHNLSNAILAMAVALEQGANPEKLKYALASFPGVKRRFTYRVDNERRVLIDDYAHHPKEIDAVYQAVTEMYPEQEKLVVFQPHLFSRTRDFIDEFALSLSKFDKVALLDIYPARELPIEGITSELLCRKINALEQSPEVVTVVEKDDIEEFINDMGTRIVIMLGAGDIGVEINKLTEKWSNA